MEQAYASMKSRFDIQPIIMLGVAFILLVLANGKFSIPAAAWLGPAFMVHFVRSRSLKVGLPTAYIALALMIAISWQGMIPIPYLWALTLMTLVFGLILWLPYLIDRLLLGKVAGFVATLVLPVAWVSIDFINALLSPYGHWAIVAYSQHGNLPLLQMLSVTGVWGVTFIVVWFASIANWVWEQGFEWGRIRTGVIAYMGIVAAILLLGGARLAISPPDAETVRVASVTADVSQESISRGSEADETAISQYHQAIHDELFRLSEIGARSGAKIVLWSEANGQVDKEAEANLIQRGRTFAREHRVYLSMALFVHIAGQHLKENKTVTLAPDGEIVSTYFKSRPPPGEPSMVGDGVIPIVETPFGVISSVICSDMDSPFHLRQQSVRAGIDIMLAPSWDWREINPYHTYLSSYRAIENGFSMVRQANDGLSMVTDYQGNVLAAMDHFTTAEPVMISQVPIQGSSTIYARIGDAFAWVCVAALILMIGLVAVRARTA